MAKSLILFKPKETIYLISANNPCAFIAYLTKISTTKLKYSILPAAVIGLIFSLITCLSVLAQETILVAENLHSLKQIEMGIGKVIRYKTRTWDDYRKGRIIEITDGLVTVEDSKAKRVTLFIDELTMLKIPRNQGRIILGGSMIAIGTILDIVAISSAIDAHNNPNKASGTETITAAAVFILILPFQIIGGVLVSPREINLKRIWKLKTFRRMVG